MSKIANHCCLEIENLVSVPSPFPSFIHKPIGASAYLFPFVFKQVFHTFSLLGQSFHEVHIHFYCSKLTLCEICFIRYKLLLMVTCIIACSAGLMAMDTRSSRSFSGTTNIASLATEVKKNRFSQVSALTEEGVLFDPILFQHDYYKLVRRS